jgi:hypothetical protein
MLFYFLLADSNHSHGLILTVLKCNAHPYPIVEPPLMPIEYQILLNLAFSIGKLVISLSLMALTTMLWSRAVRR